MSSSLDRLPMTYECGLTVKIGGSNTSDRSSILSARVFSGGLPKWLRGRFAKPLGRKRRASSNLAASSDYFFREHGTVGEVWQTVNLFPYG